MIGISNARAFPLYTSFWHVLLATAAVITPVLFGLFDSVVTETGLQYYAETPYWGFESALPVWLPMPANTAVNVGYLVVGIGWIWKVYKKHRTSSIDSGNVYFLYAFSWMSIFYAIVQSARIIGQTHRSAVLDQWFTMPIFAFGIAWSLHILYGWNSQVTLTIEVISVSSYGLALVWDYGFEAALTAHILIILVSATVVLGRFSTRASHDAFYKAIICCAGFVVLKLLDQQLGSFLPSVFKYASGHFWSKIADFLQIHYVCVFFLSLTKSAEKLK